MSPPKKAPVRTLPAVYQGEYKELDLDSFIGESIIILVFYPSNFGPNAGHSAAVLRACETMAEDVEKEVEVVGVSRESIHSHDRFASEASISLPLISDIRGELIQDYKTRGRDVGGYYLPKLSTFVIDFRGCVVEEWRSSDSKEQPPLDTFRDTISDLAPSRSARGCYRKAYARYQEGRRHVSRGLSHCENSEWPLAKTEFSDACDELSQATDLFIKSQGLAVDEFHQTAAQGQKRSSKLWEAAEWLAGFASAVEKGNHKKKKETKEQADKVLTEINEIDPVPEPLPPEIGLS